MIALLWWGAPTAVVMAEQPSSPEVGMDLVWPSPPLEARIRYLGSVATPDDIGRKKGFWTKLVEFIRGPEQENMRQPMAVAVDANGRISVADPSEKQVHVYDQKKGDYEVITDANVSLEYPLGLAVDNKNNLYVSDSDLKKIFVFSATGDFIKSVGSDAQLQRPTGIAIDLAREWLYVVDTPAHDIKVFDINGGELLRVVGKRGKEKGEFNFPSYVTVDRAGNLYVTDTLNGRIQMFDHSGLLLGEFGKFGNGSGDFSTPKGVVVDSEGHIYVADAGFDNLQIFDPDGRLLLFFGEAGQAPGEFWVPTGLFMDQQDRLYVADSYNNRIQIFQYLKVGAHE